MHRLNQLLAELREELWRVRRYGSPIGPGDLAAFVRDFGRFSHFAHVKGELAKLGTPL